MKVLVLSGSIGKKSCTRTLLLYMQKRLQARGVETIWWDLGEKSLPIAVPEYHKNQENHPDPNVREFVRTVKEADGFILGSPLYHDSFSGVLKNALDSLPNSAFSYKPVGLVSHSSNIRSCVAPCNHLRPIVRSLAGYATQQQIGTTDKDYKEEKDRLVLHDLQIKVRADSLIDELLALTSIVPNLHWDV